MSSTSIEYNETYGTTLILIRTEKALVYASDSRGTHGKSFRLVTDDMVKLEKISSTLLTCATGSVSAWRNVYKVVEKQYGKKKLGVECTLEDVAKYGQNHAKENNPTIRQSIVFIGIENKRPEAYGFLSNEKEIFHVTTWRALGSGSFHAYKILKNKFNDNLTEANAVELAERSLTESAVKDCNTGGKINVWVFDSNEFKMESYKSKAILEAYLTYYTQWEEFHKFTIYIFSCGQISDIAVTNWFSSGCLIGEVGVGVVHEIGLVREYRVRRVVLDKDASTVMKDVKYQCEIYECRAHNSPSSDPITQYNCLSIMNEKCYFAELTKEELRDVCGYGDGAILGPPGTP